MDHSCTAPQIATKTLPATPSSRGGPASLILPCLRRYVCHSSRIASRLVVASTILLQSPTLYGVNVPTYQLTAIMVMQSRRRLVARVWFSKAEHTARALFDFSDCGHYLGWGVM
ncbi:hypothetical protein CCR75_009695 [Bremia lactucae]|uniref:Uncharacterized protein n=1 Tax=Bremia lactucae TaxID=4779 RepID=A0A976FLI7_BRELC|nr:hypothetical protein CCR75_009695 [Bremia lactucae]